jgi:hypothetical protein
MANTFQSITSGAANLKNIYEGPIVSQFNDDLPIYKNIEKETKGWSGLAVIRSLKLRRNQGIGAGTDGGNLPSIGVQVNQAATINAKFNWLRFGITAGMVASSKSDAGSFVRQAAYELEEGYNDLRADVDRQISWNGRGDLCAVNTAAVASTSLSIKGRESVEAALKFVSVGMIVDIVTTSGTYKATGVQITAATGTPTALTATLTLSQAVTCAADDILVRSGAYNNEIQGMYYSLDGGTSTIYAIDRSTYQQYQGAVIDASSANLSLDLIKQSQVLARQRGGAQIKAWWTDFDTERFYEKLLVSDKRFVNTMQGDGSFTTKGNSYLEYGGSPVIPDQACPRRMFGIDPNAWKWYVLEEMKFASETGAMYIAQVDTDAWEVRVRFFANLFNQKPSACATLTGYISP